MIEKIDRLFNEGFGPDWTFTYAPQAADSVIETASSACGGESLQTVKAVWRQVGEPASLSYGVYNHSQRLQWRQRIEEDEIDHDHQLLLGFAPDWAERVVCRAYTGF